jgi:predicted nucleotide-binding protein
MAKATGYTKPLPASLTVQEMEQAIPRLRKRIRQVEAFEPDTVPADDPTSAVRALRVSIEEALIRTFGNDTVEYQRYRRASSFGWTTNFYHATPLSQIRADLAKCKQEALDLLSHAVAALEERIEEAGASVAVSTPPSRNLPGLDIRRVFVVHGHDSGPREAVARHLERMGFEPVILHEQANLGKTVIEKFESYADVGFAVVLLTPDDVGGAKDGSQKPRARQNVILELGYFIGRLSRERVCALKTGDLELPSDILGIVWTDLDTAGAWKVNLAKELSAAGYEIDWNKVMG